MPIVRSWWSQDRSLRWLTALLLVQGLLLGGDFVLLGARSLAAVLSIDLAAWQRPLDALFLGGVIAAASLLLPIAWLCLAPSRATRVPR